MTSAERQEKRSIIRMSELAKMPSALGIWGEIERWDSILSVEGLKPHLSAYQQFIREPETDGLLYTERAFDRRSYPLGNPLAIHVVGSTGVGKDETLKYMGIPWVLSDTERPQEIRDSQGKTYNFVSQEQMDESVKRGDLIEFTRVKYRDGKEYRYGTHKRRVLAMIESGASIFAFRTNQDGFTPISRFCEKEGIPIVRVLMLPNCPALEYFDRVQSLRGPERIATAKVEIQHTPNLYRIQAVLGNPFDSKTGKPIRAAAALGSWLTRIFGIRLSQPDSSEG